MADDTRNVLEVLRYELNFIEQGGYERLPKPATPFLSTPTCLNFDKELRSHACHECLLYDFVPAESQLEDVPCHYIPLNEQGDTIATLAKSGDQARLRSTLSEWLRSTIARLEQPVREKSTV
jgi:hypothetical protein